MKVLVTGAAGFIGSHLCDALLTKGYKVNALVRYNSRQSVGWLENISKKNLKIIYGDITDFDSVLDAIKDCDYVFNLAASISVPYSFKNPQTFIDTNILGALNVFRASSLNKKKIKKIIQISSSEVYGNNLTKTKNILTEETITISESPYASTKIASDNLAISMHKATGLPIVVARPFNTFGPRQSLRAVIPTLITQFISLNSRNNLIKIGNIKTSFNFIDNKGDIKFISKNLLKIDNHIEFAKIFQISSKKVKKIKQIYFDLEKNIGDKDFVITNVKINNLENEEKSAELFNVKNIQNLRSHIRKVIN